MKIYYNAMLIFSTIIIFTGCSSRLLIDIKEGKLTPHAGSVYCDGKFIGTTPTSVFKKITDKDKENGYITPPNCKVIWKSGVEEKIKLSDIDITDKRRVYIKYILKRGHSMSSEYQLDFDYGMLKWDQEIAALQQHLSWKKTYGYNGSAWKSNNQNTYSSSSSRNTKQYYQGSSGTKYKYDLNTVSGRMNYKMDIGAQMNDRLKSNYDVGYKLDRNMGQNGGGINYEY